MEFIGSENHRKFLIVFVHGLIGGKETWLRTDGNQSVAQYLEKDEQIREYFDLALYTYDTSLLTITTRIKYFFLLSLGQRVRFTKNLGIKDLTDIFLSQLEPARKDYEGIVIVAHSMGGLIAKKLILDEIEKAKAEFTQTRIKLLVTLATPHIGADLALFGKFLFRSKQIKNLIATDPELIAMNNKWVQSKDSLPQRLYCIGYKRKDNLCSAYRHWRIHRCDL